jgi:4'-phosphopantetheinyl transferase
MESNFTTGLSKKKYKIGYVSSWFPPPKDLVLRSGEVHVWRASLNLERSKIHSLQQILTADERARAERFYFQRDREYFIVARGLLRAILGRYLDMKPSQLRFYYNPHGKLALARELGRHTLRFNLSHSHGLALYAVTHYREIGIDLEYVRSNLAYEDIAERFFSSWEINALRAMPANTQKQAFFNCWTRKEAYIKAKGAGLSLPLDQFDVSLVPEEPAVLLNTNADPQDASHWSLQDLAPGPGFVAALAVEGHDWRVKYYQWPEQ